jgi:hypothetical protein
VSALEIERETNPFTTLHALLSIFLQIISSGRAWPASVFYEWLLVVVDFLFR